MIDIRIIDPGALLSFFIIMPLALVMGLAVANKIITKDRDTDK